MSLGVGALVTHPAHLAAEDPETIWLAQHVGQGAGVRVEHRIARVVPPGRVDERGATGEVRQAQQKTDTKDQNQTDEDYQRWQGGGLRTGY